MSRDEFAREIAVDSDQKNTNQSKAEHNEEKQNEQDKTEHNEKKQNKQDKTEHNEEKQNESEQNKMQQNKTADMRRLENQAKECGFSHIAALNPETIQLRPEVRNMCEKNTCHMYGSNWCCPPGVGTLEECRSRIRKYHYGILVQTTGQLEDPLDGETMMETEHLHKTSMDKMRDILEKEYRGMLTIGSGTCTRCKKCTYPDAPCRFPEYTFGSMEAYGMVVSDVCKANDLPYYYGPCTITYTGCFLLI